MPVVSLVFQDEKVFSPGGVERKVGDCIPGRSEDGIVQFALQVLGIFSKHYRIARTA